MITQYLVASIRYANACHVICPPMLAQLEVTSQPILYTAAMPWGCESLTLLHIAYPLRPDHINTADGGEAWEQPQQ